MKQNAGFTVIELLIALLIFSLVSVGALASLRHLIQAREQQVHHHEINQELDAAYANLMQDMLWFVGELTSEQNSFQFLRTQTGSQPSPLRVSYVYENQRLNRSGQVLLKNIDDFTLSWLLENQQWVGVLDQSQLDQKPLLLRIQFKPANHGEVTWIFSTPHL